MRIGAVGFFLLAVFLMQGAMCGASREPGSLSSMVNSFSDQIARSVPNKGIKPTLLLQKFDNQTHEPGELVSEMFHRVKEALQEKGYRVLEPVSDDDLKSIGQRLKEELVAYVIKGVLSETAKKLVLGARILSLKDSSVVAVALASVDKGNVLLMPADRRSGSQAITLQEISKSDPLPLKILDVSVVDLSPEKTSLLLLAVDELYIHTLENNKLSLSMKISVPVDPETKPSRDPRGSIWSYRYQNKDYVIVTTDRSGGAHILREDRGSLTFAKISSDWVLSAQAPTKPMLVSTKLLPGRNFFSGDLSVLEGESFFKYIDERVQAEELKSVDLPSTMTFLGKVRPFYQLVSVHRDVEPNPIFLSTDLDGSLRFYDARLRALRVYKDQPLGSCLISYFDPVRNASYVLATSGNAPDTTDFLSIMELKDGELKPVARSSNYKGSIAALGIGGLAGRDAPILVVVVESLEALDVESTVHVFKLTSNP